jgi:flavin-dependent dehydrogenase
MLPSDSSRPVTLLFRDRRNPERFEADLVVGAFGVNTPLVREVEKLGFGYRPPATLSTFQAEFRVGTEDAKKRYGDNIHVYLSPLRTIRYATAIPKGDYLTVTVVGKKGMESTVLREFFDQHALGKTLPRLQPYCFCYPRIAVSAARRPFSNRLVLIGDASFSRHYKNGIESAFLTARLAAEAAFERGVDADSFAAAYYGPARTLIIRDNLYGRALFRLNGLISSISPLARAHISLARRDSSVWASAQIQRILWSMFTGDAAYREIFGRVLSIRLQTTLLWNTVKTFFSRTRNSRGRQ